MTKQHGNLRNTPEKIANNFDKDGDDGCWIWKDDMGWKDAEGYAKVNYNKQCWLVHRLMYKWYVGELEDGKVIMHLCDTPSCANPKHLKQGTHRENRLDCVSKGRAANMKGSNNPNSKFTEYQIEAIRGLYAAGMTQNKLCALFNVNRRHMHKIITGKSWEELRAVKGPAESWDADCELIQSQTNTVSVQTAEE